MTKRIFCAVTAVAALILTLLAAVFVRAGNTPPVSASAAGAYDYTVERYTVEMDVSKSCVIDVEETITAYFTGSNSHGIIRDFSLGGGVTYSDFSAKCDSADFSPYFKTDEEGVLSYYLRGSSRVTGSTRTYTISYKIHARPINGALPLDVLGYGMQSQISDFSATVRLPKGYRGVDTFSGREGASSNLMGVMVDVNKDGESTVLTIPSCSVDGYGITLNVQFESGSISGSFDFSLLYAFLAGFAVLALAVAVKLVVCKQPVLVQPVNLSAPEEMDPLLMGKIIDGKVDGEDLGALIFYLASEGYIKIDLTENDEDPTLLLTEKHLPSDAPTHVQTFYDGLFPWQREDGVERRRQSVRVSQLKNKFYTTAERVKKEVTPAAGQLYQKKGNICLGILAAVTVLLFGLMGLLMGVSAIGVTYLNIAAFITSAIAFAVCAAASRVAVERQFKWKKSRQILLVVGGLLLSGVVALFSVAFPSASYSIAAGAVLIVFAALSGVIAGSCLVRTDMYNDRLGQILGFKNFIAFTEKDKIKFMLKEDPELYYRILPYAQVLGVTDAWTDKFEGLDLTPPKWCSYTAGDLVFDFIVWNSLFRAMGRGLAQNMISRPSTHGNGFGGGGHFGGFGGGGFGGGGMRGC